MKIKLTIGALMIAGAMWAAGGSGSGGGSGTGGSGGGGGSTPNPTPPPAGNSAEVRISTEMAPAGGTVQVKFSLTSPQPIMSGGTHFSAYALNGVALSSPLGDSAGVAVENNGQVWLSTVSALADLGTSDYPFLTVTMTVPASAPAGAALPVDLLPGTSLVNAAGPIAITTKPGAVNVGGTFSINEVTPGGGTYPGGTVIRILGQGFQSNAALRTPQMKFSSYKVVSPTEIDFILRDQATLDAQPVQVTSAGITQTYYSYLRGKVMQPPSRSLLKNVDPIFQQVTHALAQAGPFLAQNSGQYVALALQNPNPGPAAVTLTLTHSDGTVSSNLIVLPSAFRIMDDLAALVGVGSLQPGDLLNLTSTAAIQILGIQADEGAGTATPFLPSF